MTREEAKRRLLDIERCTPIHTREDVRDFEALEMAIKALEQQDRIMQILDDYDLEAWEILEKIKEVVKE